MEGCVKGGLVERVCKDSTTCSSFSDHGFAVRAFCFMATDYCKLALKSNNWWGIQILFTFDPINHRQEDALRQLVDVTYDCGEAAFGLIKSIIRDKKSIADYVAENYPEVR